MVGPRVLLLNNYAPPKGGAEQHVAMLHELLQSAGLAAELWTPEPPTGRLASFTDRLWNRRAAASLAERIQAFAPDVLHVHNFMQRCSPAVFATAKRHAVPTVLTVHDYQLFCPRTWAIRADGSPCDKPWLPRCAVGSCRGSLRGARGKLVYVLNALRRRFVIRQIDRDVKLVTAPAAALADRLRTQLRRPVEKLPYPFPAVQGTATAGSPPPSNDLLFVGRIAAEKGLDRVLPALREVPELGLTIAGEGPDLAALTARVAELGLGDRVRLRGWANRQQLQALYASHGAVLVASLWMDNAPLVVHEALAAGRPVLGSRRGGIPELLDDGACGLLFDPEDPQDLIRTLRAWRDMDSSRRRELGTRARSRAVAGAAESFLPRLLATYARAREVAE